MTRRYPKIVDARTAQTILAAHGVRYSVRQLQRWTHSGIAGGFQSRSGRCLFRSGAIVRTLYC